MFFILIKQMKILIIVKVKMVRIIIAMNYTTKYVIYFKDVSWEIGKNLLWDQGLPCKWK